MHRLSWRKRGTMDHTETLDTRRVMLHCELPLNEILVDFNDKIKSITRGYDGLHRPRKRHRPAQRRHRQMLRGRHQPEAEAAGEAKRRKEADEEHRQDQPRKLSGQEAFIEVLKSQ